MWIAAVMGIMICPVPLHWQFSEWPDDTGEPFDNGGFGFFPSAVRRLVDSCGFLRILVPPSP